MYIRLLIILVTLYCGISTVFAAQTFEEYQSESQSFCESSDRPWQKNKASGLVSIPDYSRLETAAINTAINQWKNDPKTLANERARLDAELDSVRIGNFSGFKTLEASRIKYRSQMNNLFACAVVTSRMKTVQNITNIVKEKKITELANKLKIEYDKLDRTKTTLNCNPSNDATIEPIQNLSDTTARQYCYYRHYLGYLQSNLADDLTNIQEIEKKVGNGDGTKVPSTISEWNQTFQKYNNQIGIEINRADTTLPTALRAFREMDQAYGAHIVLILIYDDYIRLRDALSKYMNASSQLYQKANNAQNANQQ